MHGAFRDPTVTSGQSTYYVPSKSALVGLLGGILGIVRPDDLQDWYGQAYVELFDEIHIGLEVKTLPEKTTFYSNRRSLKENKIKPFKMEVLVHPSYVVYVSSDKHFRHLLDLLASNRPVFLPYLGQAYCLATLDDLVKHDNVDEMASCPLETKTIVPDCSETCGGNFRPYPSGNGTIIVERHLHHFVTGNGQLVSRVARYWIPSGGSMLEVEKPPPGVSTKFCDIGDERIVCLF